MAARREGCRRTGVGDRDVYTLRVDAPVQLGLPDPLEHTVGAQPALRQRYQPGQLAGVNVVEEDLPGARISGTLSSAGELYGRSRSHVVIERVAVVEVERNPHAAVEVVCRMRDRELPLNGDVSPDSVGSFGLVPDRLVSGVTVIQAAAVYTSL